MKIFITGFHHSGTSFLTEVIKRLGFSIGSADGVRHSEHPELSQIDELLIGEDWMDPSFRPWREVQVPDELPEAYKNPRLMITADFWHKRFPEAKWVIINRERHDVIRSVTDDQSRPQEAGFWQKLISDYRRSWDNFVAERKPVVLELDYRELCQEPEQTLTRLATFLGADPECLAECRRWFQENVKYKTYDRG